MHSYWDDFWALKGLEDATDLAGALGREDLRARWAAVRDEFSRDLIASLSGTISSRGLPYIPGSAELADFDPTATTIALDPAGLAERLPRRELIATFERYFDEFRRRRDGKTWDAYTPYEIRTVGTFVRMGWRERAEELLDFFMAGRRPAGWNGWAEVVGREPRAPRFIGDMPHAWVASDFVRSILEAVAFDRENGTLVVGAGVPAAWLPLHVGPLPTYHGTIDVRMRRDGDGVVVELKGDVGEVLLVSPFDAGARVRVKVPSSLRWPLPSPRRTGVRAPDRPRATPSLPSAAPRADRR